MGAYLGGKSVGKAQAKAYGSLNMSGYPTVVYASSCLIVAVEPSLLMVAPGAVDVVSVPPP